MKIIFRQNFHALPGQSLWLKLTIVLERRQVCFEQILPLHWINDRQWETQLEVHGGGGPLRLEHAYQMRQQGNGVMLDEWGAPRSAKADPSKQDAMLLWDTWRSAGTVDCAFETAAFKTVLAARGPFAKPLVPQRANHTFQLRMAAVPAGMAPCLVGSVREIGDWVWARAIPLREVAANVWRASLYLPVDWRIEYKYGMLDLQTGCAVSLEAGDNRVLDARQFAPRQWTMVNDESYRRDPAGLYRAGGVAIPVFSLRSDRGLGVGEFADLKALADWAGGVGLQLIQILPVNDTTSALDWSDSYPYSAISVFALHPLYLRIDDLGYAMPAAFNKDLEAARRQLNALAELDYPKVMQAKTLFTRRIFKQHRTALTTCAGLQKFLAENREWVVPYAAFCLHRDHFGTADFNQWQDDAAFDCERVAALADPHHPAWPETSYHIWLQYELDRQLTDAVKHLHQRGLALKGDLPIGIARHSVDAWQAPHLFNMDAQAGAPPDAFTEHGQNWRFPTYHWAAMRADGYAWWHARIAKLNCYFDACRIDHILGFFRIWQIPLDQVEGIMGWFEPALPVHIDELVERGIPFDHVRYCQPYIRDPFLRKRFGDTAGEVKETYLDDGGDGAYQLREHVATQRRIVEHFATLRTDDPAARERIWRMRDGLLDCASEVLFFEVPGSNGTLFHPRWALQMTRSFQELDSDVQRRVDELYIDYFHRRQEGFWQAQGYEKLPVMRQASPMLLCGEDLGMVPACVPGVLHDLGILSLEIPSMPKRPDLGFANPAHAPYMSVVSPSTHDMPTLRSWWREDSRVTANFAWQMLGEPFAPSELAGELASRIILQHLQSPAMWAIFPLQDLLAIDESIRHPDPAAERINVPAIMPYRWCYRMHLKLDALAAAGGFNGKLMRLLQASGRAHPA
ncbi:MAG: 4-alpha-glucanotransferase [Verrucomicrobia bacterium]|nr:4-alpha-glucanotransferase [Verrucomicrobiota bacterium]